MTKSGIILQMEGWSMEKKALWEENATKMTVIFDNGGGTTLQIRNDGHSGNLKFGHYYDDPKYAANDFFEFLEDGCTCGWEGSEDESVDLDPSSGEIENGGYATRTGLYTLDESLNYDDEKDYWGCNEKNFLKALSEKIK
jgi:hypothetical protein